VDNSDVSDLGATDSIRRDHLRIGRGECAARDCLLEQVDELFSRRCV
jgi:hypothetical protein